MIFTKDDIGKEIYAIPTGNNARCNNGRIRVFKVLSVGKIYVGLSAVFDSGSIGREEKYHKESGATQRSINSGYRCNAGYKFFKSIEALVEYKELQEAQNALDEKFRYFNTDSLNKSQIERINCILNEVNQ